MQRASSPLALSLVSTITAQNGNVPSVVDGQRVRWSDSGAYGQVYLVGDLAVKTWAEDPAYERWLEFVLADDGKQVYSKHLPVVHWYSKEMRVAVLEKLTPTKVPHPRLDYPMGLWSLASLHREEPALVAGQAWVLALYAEIEKMCREELPNGHAPYHEDCHAGNWMQRADGTIVVTDPMASCEESSS